MLQAKVQNMSNYRYPGGPIFNPFGFGMGVGAGDFKTLKEKEIKNDSIPKQHKVSPLFLILISKN